MPFLEVFLVHKQRQSSLTWAGQDAPPTRSSEGITVGIGPFKVVKLKDIIRNIIQEKWYYFSPAYL